MHVGYDCTSEASPEEENGDSRDHDDNPEGTPEERHRQQHQVQVQLTVGHQSLLITPSGEKGVKGFTSPKLPRARGQGDITAELIRSALTLLITLMVLVWK